MKHWYWYVADKTELMVDCDGALLLEIAQKRLARSGLPVERTFIAPSTSEEHFHLVIKLSEPINTVERQVWQLFLMDHVYRSVNNLFRALNGTPSPSLLISPMQWLYSKNCEPPKKSTRVHYFWRPANAICHCEEKHKGPLLSGCIVGQTLRGFSDAPNNLKLGTNL